MSEAERRDWLTQATAQRAQTEALMRAKPVSRALLATVDAHHALIDVLNKKLTPQQLEAVRDANIEQFRRLTRSLIELAQVFVL